MPFTPQTLEDKPYNVCIQCQYIGEKCDGPNFLAMEMSRLCEWARLRKEYLRAQDPKWTNAYIAETAKVAKVTVDRFLAGKADDIKYSTIQSILRVLVNGSWGKYPCAMASDTEPQTVYVDNPQTAAECERLRSTLNTQAAEFKRMQDFYEKEIEFKDNQMLQKDKQLNERADYMRRKDRYIAFLAIGFVLALFVIIAALIMDKLNSDIGFFWLEDTLTHFSKNTNNALQGFFTNTKL